MRLTTKRRLQSGQVMVLLGLMIVVLIGFLGLAVDGGRLYVERRILQNGADAASLAAGDLYWQSIEASRSTSGQPAALSSGLNAGATEFAYQARISATTFVASGQSATNCPNDGDASHPSQGNVYTLGGFTLRLCAFLGGINGGNLVNSQGKLGAVFDAYVTESIRTAFISVVGGGTSLPVVAHARSVSGAFEKPPILMVLDPQDPNCTGNSQSLIITGGSNGTVNGNVYSNGNIFWNSGNAAFTVSGGGVFDHCDLAPITNFTFTGSPAGTFHAGAAELGDPLNTGSGFQDGWFTPNYVDPYTGPTTTPSVTTGVSGTGVARVDMAPGVYGTDPAFGGFTSPTGCWFLEPGIYNMPAVTMGKQGIVSNELTPPNGVNPTTNTTTAGGLGINGETPTFNWNINSSTCEGSFSVQVLAPDATKFETAITPGTKVYIAVAASREEHISGATSGNFWRESYLGGGLPANSSMVNTNAAGGFCSGPYTAGGKVLQVDINNVPGMGYTDGVTQATQYDIYASTASSGSAPCPDLSTFGFVGNACPPASNACGDAGTQLSVSFTQSNAAVSGCGSRAGLPADNGSTRKTPGSFANASCSLGSVASNVIDSVRLPTVGFPSASYCSIQSAAQGGTGPLSTPQFLLGIHLPPAQVGCKPAYTSTALSSPDTANQTYCLVSGSSACDPTFPPTGAVTPGFVMLYFPATDPTKCWTQSSGDVSWWLFGGSQLESVVVWSQPGGCAGSSGGFSFNGGGTTGQFLGILYAPGDGTTAGGVLVDINGTAGSFSAAFDVWDLKLAGGMTMNLSGIVPLLPIPTASTIIVCTDPGACPHP